MEILRLLKELESLIENQKTLLGVTYNFAPDDFLVITDKIRATVPGLLSLEPFLEKASIVLERHISSPEEVAAIISEIGTECHV